MLSALLTGKLAALAVCASVGVGGAATAAYANVLPAPIQGFAHSAIDAPAPHPDASHSGEPSHSPEPSHSAKTEPTRSVPQSLVPKPSPTRTESPELPPSTAAYGLCRAYAEATAHGVQLVGSLQEKLVALAGGAANIAAFCATVPKPTPNPSEHHDASTNPVATAELCKIYNRGAKLTGPSLELLVRLAGGTDRVRALCSAYPTPSPVPTVTHTGDATSTVAFGLCNGYRHGTLPEKYLAMLDQLAGGADHVAAFCATVPQPTGTPHAEPSQAPPSSPVI